MSIGDIDVIWMVLSSVASSAYKIKLKYLLQYGTSFMYMRNKNGARIE